MNPPSSRAADGADRHDGGGHALVLATLARRHEGADQGEGARADAAGADALHDAEGDQLAHGLGRPAQGGADDEHGDRRQIHALAADQIAELAPDRGGHG